MPAWYYKLCGSYTRTQNTEKEQSGFIFLQMLLVVDIQTLVIRSSFIAAIKEVSQQLSHIRQDLLQAQPEWKNEVKHWEIQSNSKKSPNSFFPKPARAGQCSSQTAQHPVRQQGKDLKEISWAYQPVFQHSSLLAITTGLLAFKCISYLHLVKEMQRKIWNLVLVLHLLPVDSICGDYLITKGRFCQCEGCRTAKRNRSAGSGNFKMSGGSAVTFQEWSRRESDGYLRPLLIHFKLK